MGRRGYERVCRRGWAWGERGKVSLAWGVGEEPGVQRDREFGGVCGWGLKEEVVGSAGVYAAWGVYT